MNGSHHNGGTASSPQPSFHLRIRYNQLGRVEGLEGPIALARYVLSLHPPGHLEWLLCLNHLAFELYTRYRQVGRVGDLNEAILFERNALAHCQQGHPGRWLFLTNLASHLSIRYNCLASVGDLNEAIALSRDALALCPSGHPHRSRSLNDLSSHLLIRYKQLGEVEDIEEAIAIARDGLALRPLGHPDRPTSLNNLATFLSTRYNQLGGTDDLNEAIMLNREALALCQHGYVQQSASLSNLASSIHTRYSLLGEEEDLNESIFLSREALVFCPPGHPERWIFLNNLASHLYSRYNQLRGAQDLNETISLDRDALALCPPGHLHRSSALNNLASHLFLRHQQFEEEKDLEKSILLARDSLELRPLNHPERSASLNNLAMHISTRYDLIGKIEDLNEAIVLNRDALALCPLGHPHRMTALNNIATHLSTRFKQLGREKDLEEAILCSRDALALCIPGHPNRALPLSNLAAHLTIRYRQVRDFLHLGSSERYPSLFMQLGEVEDRDELFGLYAQLQCVSQPVSSDDLSAAKAWINAAEYFRHSTTLLAYKTALRLLVHHLAILPSLPQHRTVLRALSSSLAADAFSACLRNQSPINAIELLEQGRCVFWGQLSRLRSPLDDVISSGPAGKALADEFTRLTSLIRQALKLPSTDQHDRVCHLNLELQKVASRIRELPGLSCFLLPSRFSDLRRAADDGPVVIMNASKYGCDVLIVSVDQDPVHIVLSITKEAVLALSLKLRTLTVRSRRANVTRELGFVLRELWDQVVSPVVDLLQRSYPFLSRIWWCPTAEFTLLPLHAAGPYRKGQQNLADLYISSYTPTLTTLIRARQRHPSNGVEKQKYILGIGQANATGESELFSVGTELTDIGRQVDNLATFTCIEGPESRISRVIEELGKNQWVHFACHGLPNRENPFESAFALHDGYFTIQHIIQCDLKDPEFAYLSACHTTVGDADSPDEVIHLAAAMQFTGFRSVIGTMWAVDDAETNKITSVFYKHMVDQSGRLDYTRAAFALWKTMRSVCVPLDQRILYIHIGV